jgi:UDP-N-acetylmuramyl pentapeptide phosphotransferase/UDP-N-acetylglucosamine-1-phosphate transferase
MSIRGDDARLPPALEIALARMFEFAGIVFIAACAITFLLLLSLKPVLRRYALAKPNARSSHKLPTPQGGGIAVIAAIITAVGAVAVLYPSLINEPVQLVAIFIAVIALAAVGIADDIRPIDALPRLFLQALAVAFVLASLPEDLRVSVVLPWWIERALMFGAVLWLVNLVNFMDGIDWMTVAEVVPVAGSLALFGVSGALPPEATLVAFGLCGAMIGFAPFNRPVARLFLGDVGSLPIGMILSWLLVLLAARDHFAAAALLPLYYASDATITLLCRLANGEPVAQAHRSHFYQRALDGGLSVYQIVGGVFVVNVILAGFAAATILNNAPIVQVTMLAAGCALVAALLWTFNYASHRHR